MSRHVVFGTGQIGRLVAERLVSLGADVTPVNRTGRGAVKGTRIVAGDATDPTFTARVCAGADAVYFCLNAPHYGNWAQEFPPMQQGVLAAAEAAGARLVVLDNLYAYGPVGGRDLVESLPANPTSAKAATRAAMTADLLSAHRAGRVAVAIGRASDFFGPGITRSALGETVFGTAVNGRIAQVMGQPDLEHSYSYGPDVAAALVTLGTQPDATGRVWHLPVAEARTTRDIVDQVYALAGRRPGSSRPAGPRCGCSAWSGRRCASTCTPSTSSASAGSSTTANSVLRSAFSRRHSTTPWPPPPGGTATRGPPPALPPPQSRTRRQPHKRKGPLR